MSDSHPAVYFVMPPMPTDEERSPGSVDLLERSSDAGGRSAVAQRGGRRQTSRASATPFLPPPAMAPHMVDVFDLGPVAPPEDLGTDRPLPPPPQMSPPTSGKDTKGRWRAVPPRPLPAIESAVPPEASARLRPSTNGSHTRVAPPAAVPDAGPIAPSASVPDAGPIAQAPSAGPASVTSAPPAFSATTATDRSAIAPTAAPCAAASAENDTEDPDVDAIVRFTTVGPKELKRAERIMTRLEVPRPLAEVLLELKLLTEEELEQARAARWAGMSLVDILAEENHLSHEGRSRYDALQDTTPTPSDREILVEGGLVREEHYLRALGSKVGVPFVTPEIGDIDVDAFATLPFDYLSAKLVLPVGEVDGTMRVIVAIPDDEALKDDLERRFFMPVDRQCATGAKILEALRTIERLHGQATDDEDFGVDYGGVGPDVDEVGEAEAIQLVDYLLTRAIQLEASDLHIEPGMSRVRVRVRVDGVLHHLTDLPSDFAPRVAERVKVIARLDAKETRRHQHGKVHVRADGRDADVQVSTFVSTFGEAIVMRLEDHDRSVVPLEQIGFQAKAWARIDERILKAMSGLVLIAGPSGGGKTSTLYSFLDEANDPARKVITCEDPVECTIDGVVQASVNPDSGPTMAESLRSIVRQDPDTIGIGEIRDQETARLAVEAALAGNKVYSTFHTDDAVGAFVRLVEMGVEPFLVGSTVTAVIAQRLVRRLCTQCKSRHRAGREELRFLGMRREDLGDRRFMGARECASCGGTGYRGRVAIHEVLIPDDDFKAAVMNGAPQNELRRIARSTPGFLTIMEDGVLKAAQGVTSLDEIIEHAPRDARARTLSEIETIMSEGGG